MLPLTWCLFADLIGTSVFGGIELGEDATVIGLPSGVDIPLDDPGSSGSLVQFWSGVPQRTRFLANADSGKPDRDFGTSPDNLFPETLKS